MIEKEIPKSTEAAVFRGIFMYGLCRRDGMCKKMNEYS